MSTTPFKPTPGQHFYKINWAWKQADQLGRAVIEWFASNQHHTYSIEPDPNVPRGSILKVSAEEIPVSPCSLIIGDVIHNVRSSLDHIAFSLAMAHTKPFTQELMDESQFPIIGDEDRKGTPGQGAIMFQNNAKKRSIKCIHPDAQNFIETVQPYNLGARYKAHPLWKLRQLSNADKHKILHISAACAESYNVRDCYIEGILTNEPGIVKNNRIIAKLGIIRPKDKNKSLKELVNPRMNIAFSEGSLKNSLVLNTLNEIIQFVGKEVLTPLQRFL